MSLLVHTGRHPCHGQPGYVGTDALDVSLTAADIGATFAPSRVLENAWNRRKRAARADEQALQAAFDWFAPLYLAEMAGKLVTHLSDFEALLSEERVVLCCYCGTSSRCHRRLLAALLARLGAVDGGELPPGMGLPAQPAEARR